MTQGLRNRSLLTIADLTADEIRLLLKLAAELKAAKLAGTEQRRLQGKNIALIFEKPSTRTRIGFEVAAYDQGAHVTYLGPSGTQMGEKETIKDTARVLGRIYDAIEYRGFSQTTVEELARHAGVPVFNGLTDEFHPTQVLGDFMTMREFTHKHLSGLVTAFIGDARNNVACSLAMGAMKVGMEMRLCGPKLLQPDREFIKQLEEIGTPTGGKVVITDDPRAAVRGADFIYTDVWLSMGESKELWSERIRLLKPYQVNMELLQASGNPHTKFMHCLPAFHDTNTAIAAQVARDFGVGAMEVTDDVFESAASIVFDQAENRMHTIKALLVATIGS